MMNCSQAPGFILLGLSSNSEKWQPLFSIFLVLYLLGLLGNLLLLLAIGTDVHLHTPMYFFLSQLSLVDLCFITTTAPKMLETLWTGDGSISFSGCLTQLYFFAVFADIPIGLSRERHHYHHHNTRPTAPVSNVLLSEAPFHSGPLIPLCHNSPVC